MVSTSASIEYIAKKNYFSTNSLLMLLINCASLMFFHTHLVPLHSSIKPSISTTISKWFLGKFDVKPSLNIHAMRMTLRYSKQNVFHLTWNIYIYIIGTEKLKVNISYEFRLMSHMNRVQRSSSKHLLNEHWNVMKGLTLESIYSHKLIK